MGILSTRLLAALLLLPALPVVAQDDAYKAQHQINYKRFTRGSDGPVVDEARGRLEWFRERMGGDLGPDFTLHLLREAEKERAKYPSLFPAAGGSLLPTALGLGGPEKPVALNGTTWVNLGPTKSDFTQNGYTLTKVDSGRPRVILPDTADTSGNTVYLLACGGGLWKTTDFTTTCTWTALTDFVGSNVSGSAAFGRSTSTLFVGAGDPFDNGIGGFMVKSTNGGTSWSPAIQLGTASKICDIKVDTSLASDVVLVGTNVGLYRSANAGGSYTQVTSIPATSVVWSLVKTSVGWVASTETTGTGAAGSIYLSTDQGATWTLSTTSAFASAGRITLGIGLPLDSTVYAFAANNGDNAQLDLFKSLDGGSTWTALGITNKVPVHSNPDNPNMNIMGGQAWYNHMILVDPLDASRNTVYLGGQLASAKTTDGGATWTLISNWLPGSVTGSGVLPYIHADFHCAASSNLNGTARLYFGTDGGLFTSTNGGTTWDDTKNIGLVNHLIYALAANPGVPGSALVGLQDNGTRIRSGVTSTFNQVRGGDGFGVAWAQDVTTSSAVSMSSYVYNSIRRSTTSPVVDQSNWLSFTSGLATPVDSTGYYFVTPIVTPPAGADPTGQVFFTYGSTGRIYQSNALGWSLIGSAGNGGISIGRIIRAVSHGIGVSPTNLQRIAAAGNGGYLLLSTTGGASWNEVFLGAAPTTPGLVTNWQGYNSNIAWANDSLLYVCSESPLTGATRVAKSTNGGSSWSAASGTGLTALPDIPVTKLAVDPGDGTGNTVYAATWLGVYRTTDGGVSWRIFGTGLPQGRATDIWVAPDSSSIRVATWGRGVWEITNSAVPGTVSITPSTAFLYTADVATFTGTVNGGGTVTYSATGGAITSGGIYTAGSAAGDFTVTATNAADTTQKAVANVTLAVAIPVTFSQQPASLTSAVGHTATFAVAASGSGTLAYQWNKGGSAITGANTASYTTPILALIDTGSVFTCTVTGKAGPVTSNPATLTVQSLGTAVIVSNSTVTAIPDATTAGPGAPITISFPVSGMTGNVGEVTFSLYLTHTWVGDLVVTLIAPDNSTVILSNNAGGPVGGISTNGSAFGSSCGNYLVFSDLGTASISTQLAASGAPIVGTFQPSFPLSAFNGKAPNGTWTLRIQDTGPADVGTYQCGVLSVKPLVALSLDLNGDGVTDLRDLLFFAKNYGTANATCDLNGDGTVNDLDLTILLAGL